MNCWVFLIAGYETSSTALAYLSHVLCNHPQVQDGLANEILSYQRSVLFLQVVTLFIRLYFPLSFYSKIPFSSLPTLTYLNREEKERTGSQELSYATVQKMEYLDQVVKETLRLYPPAPSVIRRQTAEEVQLKVPEGSVRVSKIIPKFPVTCDWARANL